MSDGLDALAMLGERMAERRDYIAELEQENERLDAELNDERTARLLADNRVAELEEAIANHRRAKSGTAADEALWWWVQ